MFGPPTSPASTAAGEDTCGQRHRTVEVVPAVHVILWYSVDKTDGDRKMESARNTRRPKVAVRLLHVASCKMHVLLQSRPRRVGGCLAQEPVAAVQQCMSAQSVPQTLQR